MQAFSGGLGAGDHILSIVSAIQLAEGHVKCVAHAPPTMVFFFLFLFTPLLAAMLLTVYVTLCKPGCAISTADMSSV